MKKIDLIKDIKLDKKNYSRVLSSGFLTLLLYRIDYFYRYSDSKCKLVRFLIFPFRAILRIINQIELSIKESNYIGGGVSWDMDRKLYMGK